jgi:hypothetical protein
VSQLSCLSILQSDYYQDQRPLVLTTNLQQKISQNDFVSDEDFEKMVGSGSFGAPPKRQPDKVIGAEDYGDSNGYIISFRFFVSALTIIHLALREPSMVLEPVDFQKTHPDLMMMAWAIEGLRRPLLHRAYFSQFTGFDYPLTHDSFRHPTEATGMVTQKAPL